MDFLIHSKFKLTTMRNTLLFSFILLLISCAKDESPIQFGDLWTPIEPNAILEDLKLPEGTLTHNRSDNEIKFKLPEGYNFVNKSRNGGIRFDHFGTYSCKCSGTEGSCTVFYHKEVGFGCLQSDCSGDCTSSTGNPTNEQLIGIVDTNDGLISISDHLSSGSLTKEGYEWFFEQKELQNQIKEHYDLVLENTKFSSSEDFISNSAPNEITYLPVKYYGIEFSLAIPIEKESVKNQLMPDIVKKSGPKVSCTGSSNCSCAVEKKCVFGNCIYYCGGCSLCTMDVRQ